MGETKTVQDAPVMAPAEQRTRVRAWPLAMIGVVAVVASPSIVTFSAASEYGGTDADGNWVDALGNVVTEAPPTVSVVGHVAPAALVTLLVIVVAGIVARPVLARFGRPNLGDTIRRAAYFAAPVCIVVGILVYTVWQGHVVMDQVGRQVLEPHGFPWGGVTVTTGHMAR